MIHVRVRTLRGRIEPNTATRLIVDDGQFTHGMRVKRFLVFPENPASGGDDSVYGTLALDQDGSATRWLADDNRQIGWASTNQAATGYGAEAPFSYIDPDHIVVRDLWIMCSRASGTEQVNFVVELEPTIITEDQAVLALLKEVSQDV